MQQQYTKVGDKLNEQNNWEISLNIMEFPHG